MMLLMAGAEPAFAAKVIDHSVEMFLKVYARWIDDGHTNLELDRINAFIKSPTGQANKEAA